MGKEDDGGKGGQPGDGDVMDELLDGEEEKKEEPNESQAQPGMNSGILDKHISQTPSGVDDSQRIRQAAAPTNNLF